ncbi:MAG: AI-2E family transporter [Alphaproteobacteria bacterium]|nr:AI-2E family transporter [Alphaproteobacteria bacterium]
MPDQLAVAGGGRGEEQTRGITGMLTFLTVGLVVTALYFAREVLVPFALAVLLSFLLAPAVRLLRRLRAGRVTAVGLTVVVAFLSIFAFGAVVAEEVSLLGPHLPEYQHNIEVKLRALPRAIPLQHWAAELRHVTTVWKRSETAPATPTASSPDSASTAAEPAKPLPVQIESPGLNPLQLAETVVGPLLQPLAMAGLVIVLVVFMLLEREVLRDRLLRLAGAGDLHRTTEAMNEAAQRVSRYLASQLAVNAVEGTLIGIGLAIIGIPNAALWGILTLLLRFIPYLGIVIAAAFPMALAFAVAPGWSLLVWTAVLYIGIEMIVANLVEPRLYAGTTGLSSVAVLVAAVFWTWLWGPIGLLLSTPITACLLVLGRHVPQLHFLDVLLGSEPVLTPDESFYQRLLAGDPEEATEQAEEFIKERSIDEFAEQVALPVLARAQADSDHGILPPERREAVKNGFARILENLSDDSVIEDPINEGDAKGSEGGFIVCLAGRNELDEAAAMLLASLLRARGHRAYVFAIDSAGALGGHRVALRDAAVVCLSLISTASAARARHIVRRLRRRAPRARIIVGFWGLDATNAPSAEMLPITSADAIATTLAEAIADVEAQVPALLPLASAAGEEPRSPGGARRAHAG